MNTKGIVEGRLELYGEISVELLTTGWTKEEIIALEEDDQEAYDALVAEFTNLVKRDPDEVEIAHFAELKPST